MNDLERARKIKGELVKNRRHLHQNPEVGMEMPRTAAFVMERLKEIGLNPKICGKSGVTATIGGKRGGPVFLLRADMDALPMREESGLEFSSRGEAAHTCGHDLHTAMLLGAARLLKEEEDELPGTIKLMFQPAEETLEGAKAMIADGILENPRVDGAMGVHMAAMTPTGLIRYGKGIVNTSSDIFQIEIVGKGGHGASPHMTVDPVNAGVHIHLALQELIARESDPQEHAALTIGLFQSGSAPNIIPETALLGGTLRAVSEETRAFLMRRVEEATALTAQAFRAVATLKAIGSTCALRIDELCADQVGRAFSELFGKGAALSREKVAGSEDFAEVSARVPSVFFLVGGGSESQGCRHGLHHPKIRFDEDCLPYGAAAFVAGAKAWLLANQKP